jgi:tyrosinase
MFGHHIVHAPVTFTIPLSGTLATMRQSRLLEANAPLSIQVVPERMTMPRAAAVKAPMEAKAEVLSIVVEAH